MLFRILIIGLLFFFLTSCAKDGKQEGSFINAFIPSEPELSSIEFKKYIEEKQNGLHIERSIQDYVFDLQFKPVSYVILQDLKEKITSENLSSMKEEYEDFQYFTLTVKTNFGTSPLTYNLTSQEEYNARLNYLAFQLNNDIKLVDGKDTLACVLFHFERDYEVRPFNTFLLGFEKCEDSSIHDKIIIYDDKIFNVGKVILRIKKENIQNIPILKI